MFKHGILKLCNIAIECRLIGGVYIVFVISTSKKVGTESTLLMHLDFVTHGDVLTLNSPFINNVDTNAVFQ